jgi:hypothetical protein
MAQEHSTFKPSIGLVILDAIGTLFLGLGLAKMFAGLDFLPASLAIDQSGFGFIILGIALMLPMLIQLFVYLRTQAEKKLTK